MPDYTSFQGLPNARAEVAFVSGSRPAATDETKLIDMEDYTNLDIFIETFAYTPPTVLFGGAGTADGNLTTPGTIASIASTDTGDGKLVGKVDWGSIALRTPKARVNRITAVVSVRHDAQLWVSDDDISYSLVDNLATTTASAYTVNLTGAQQSFRYARVTVAYVSGNTSNINWDVSEIFDGDIFGGTVDISLQLKNADSGEWLDIVTSAMIGTTTDGPAVHGSVGRDGETLAGFVKNFNLPKTQTDLRMRLQVTSAGSVTSVSILKSGGY